MHTTYCIIIFIYELYQFATQYLDIFLADACLWVFAFGLYRD